MATVPNFTKTPVMGIANISAANTNRDGTGTIVDVITGAAVGTRIERITVVATGTTTAGVVRLYLFDGTNTRLLREVLVTAITASVTVSPFLSILTNQSLSLPSGSKLRASTNNAEAFNVIAEGGNYDA